MYAAFKLLPVQQKLVLISRLNEQSSIDFQRIVSQAHTDYPQVKVIVLNHKMRHPVLHIFDIIQEMYHLATSKACIVESYVIAVSVLHHRPSLKIIQIWHALGAVKAFGHMALNKPEGSSKKVAQLMHMHRNYTYATAGSKATAAIFAKAFNMPKSKILPVGMPRVDYLLDKSKQRENKQVVRQHYGISSRKKVILYAPTFRNGSKIPYVSIIEAVDAQKFTLIIKQHRRDKSKIKPKAGVIVDRAFDMLELLPAADAVITDYSATVFEAALIGKPLFFWHFDKTGYEKRRGFSMATAALPGIKSDSIETILSSIKAAEYDADKIAAFSKKYVELQDGSSTHRILNLALKGEKS